MAQAVIVTAFNSIAVATQHPHWIKDEERVEPIVGPLCRMIEQLPKATLKAFEKRFNGAMLAVGALVVIGPDVTEEIRLRREKSLASQTPGEPQQGAYRGAGYPRYPNAPGAPAGGSAGVQGANGSQPPAGAGGNDASWSDALAGGAVSVDYPLPG